MSIKNYSSELMKYRQTFIDSFNRLNLDCLAPVLSELSTRTANSTNQIFVCGNGGSAALAQHFVIDLGLGTRRVNGKTGSRIFDLTSNVAVLTATANDSGYRHVFSSQIDLYAKKGDVLIVISSSGNSDNIIEAIKKAKEMGLTTIGLTGFDGGQVRGLVEYSIHVETAIGLYGVVEDLHSFVLHLLTHFMRLMNQGN